MREEILDLEEETPQQADRDRQVWALGEVLEELLAQYEVRYPDLKLVVGETSPAAVS